LLSVVGGIVTPTSGSVEVEGAISTLLELMVGMQKDLPGIDNIRIIGGFLGLSAGEIRERTPKIAEFADLGEALKRPVKTYSTGMAMRLGFSIALHAEFDIFLVDEVLAVGDTNFHRKCINRMRELHTRDHKTIILASHGLGEVSALADRLVLLQSGRILRQGKTEKVLAAYWRECERERNRIGHRVQPLKGPNPYGDDLGDLKIEGVRFLDEAGGQRHEFHTGERLIIEIWFNAVRPVDNPLFRVQIFRNDGIWVHGMNSYRHGCDVGRVQGEGCMRLEYQALYLLEGDYYVSVGVWPDEYSSMVSDVAFDLHEQAYTFRVQSERHQGAGIITLPSQWTFIPPGSKEAEDLARELRELSRPAEQPSVAAPQPPPDPGEEGGERPHE
jgi:ABC-type polysaccharide/polyol phosphate transport system ATPase subunit